MIAPDCHLSPAVAQKMAALCAKHDICASKIITPPVEEEMHQVCQWVKSICPSDPRALVIGSFGTHGVCLRDKSIFTMSSAGVIIRSLQIVGFEVDLLGFDNLPDDTSKQKRRTCAKAKTVEMTGLGPIRFPTYIDRGTEFPTGYDLFVNVLSVAPFSQHGPRRRIDHRKLEKHIYQETAGCTNPPRPYFRIIAQRCGGLGNHSREVYLGGIWGSPCSKLMNVGEEIAKGAPMYLCINRSDAPLFERKDEMKSGTRKCTRCGKRKSRSMFKDFRTPGSGGKLTDRCSACREEMNARRRPQQRKSSLTASGDTDIRGLLQRETDLRDELRAEIRAELARVRTTIDQTAGETGRAFAGRQFKSTRAATRSQ